MGRLARFVLHHRRLVLLAWAVILIAGLATTQKTVDRLSFDFSLPGQPGHETSVKVNKIYGNGGEQQPSILVLTSKDGTPLPQAAVTATFAKVGAAVPQARIVDFANTRDPSFVVDGGSVQYAPGLHARSRTASSSPESKQLEAALIANAPPGATAAITGLGELSHQRAEQRAGRPAGDHCWGPRRPGGARVRLRLVPGARPAAIAAVSILSTFLILLGRHLHRPTCRSSSSSSSRSSASVSRSTTRCWSSPAGARNARTAATTTTAVVVSMRDRRPGGRLQRRHGRDRPGRAHRAAGAVPALDRLRRHAHSAGRAASSRSPCCRRILAGIGPRVDWPRIRHEAEASRSWTRWGI